MRVTWFVVRWTNGSWQVVQGDYKSPLTVVTFSPNERCSKAAAFAAGLRWCRLRSGSEHPEITFI